VCLEWVHGRLLFGLVPLLGALAVSRSFGPLRYDVWHIKSGRFRGPWRGGRLGSRRGNVGWLRGPEGVVDGFGKNVAYLRRGGYRRAGSLFVVAHSIYADLAGARSLKAGEQLCHLGRLFVAMTRYAEAEEALVDCFEIHKELLGIDHPTTIEDPVNQLQGLYTVWRQPERAVATMGAVRGVVQFHVDMLAELGRSPTDDAQVWLRGNGTLASKWCTEMTDPDRDGFYRRVSNCSCQMVCRFSTSLSTGI
jgi:hypothetical protein